MRQKRKPVPKFSSEAEERSFWESGDSTDYVDWRQAERVRVPRLKPSTQAISLRPRWGKAGENPPGESW